MHQEKAYNFFQFSASVIPDEVNGLFLRSILWFEISFSLFRWKKKALSSNFFEWVGEHTFYHDVYVLLHTYSPYFLLQSFQPHPPQPVDGYELVTLQNVIVKHVLLSSYDELVESLRLKLWVLSEKFSPQFLFQTMIIFTLYQQSQPIF